MKIPTGDYIGFSFDGNHSSSLGIVRTSNGSRFNQNLLPPSQDKIVPVPGGDGAYYFGSYYQQKQFNISFAFDSLTEEQIKRIQRLFGDKKIHSLVFDELPYKEYRVKVTGNSIIKYIPFAQGNTNRLYKGEGDVTFTAFSPFAIATHKFLDDPYYNNYKNRQEWKDVAGLKETQGDFDKVANNTFSLYNPGDLETDWILTIPFKDSSINITEISIYDGKNSDHLIGLMKFNKILKATGALDTEIKINSKTNLIEGYFEQEKTGNLYNNFLVEGSFIKIPVGENIKMILTGSGFSEASINYNYKYF